MSSSIFEVRESESDSEKVLEFGLDTCEENGIMSTQIDGELPKDHTYTKEPDVLQEDGMRDSDNSSNQPEEMGGIASTPTKSKPTRATKTTRNVGRGKPKKNVVAKKEPPSKKGKTKKDDISEEVDAISESAGNGQIGDASLEASNANEEDTKPAKRGRKRKIEDKGNVENEEAQDGENSPANENSEKNPKKRAASAAKAKKVNKGKGDAEDTVVDHDNLPPGWVRKSVVRKSGKTAGQIDVYIYSPDGFKFRSKPDVASYLARTKSNLKLDHFDFGKKRATEKSTSSSTTKQAPQKKPVAEKPKTPIKRKSKPATPKKSPKLLVKIVSAKPRKSRATKESPAKVSKSPAKGKVSKVNKKKMNA